jgi:hypothetical protein
MKKITLILLTALCVAACKKEPLPGDKSLYSGMWMPKTASEDVVYELEILPDGTGRYHHVKPGLTVDVSGNVYFQNSNQFTIGGRVIRKKFKVDEPPVRIVESLKPYKYRVETTINGVTYLRTEER